MVSQFKGKDKRKQLDKNIKEFLKTNNDVKLVLDAYFDENEAFYRMKDGDGTSIELLLEEIKDTDIHKKIMDIKYLWKAIYKNYGFK